MPELSPLAPQTTVTLPSIKGVRLGGVACGVKKNGRKDLCLMVFDKGTTVAGVLTRSLTAAAPVLWCKKNLHGGFARALVANAGNSNAFTGKNGASNTFPTDGSTYATQGTMQFVPTGPNAYFGYVPYRYPHPLATPAAASTAQ